MSSSINKNVNVERRTWDKETYEARASSRAAAEAAVDSGGASASAAAAAAGTSADDTTSNDAATALKNEIDPTEEKEEFALAQQGRAGPEGSQRAFLKSRSRKVDLEGKLGSTEIIDPAAASATKSNLSDDTSGALTPSSGVSKCTDGVGWHCRVCDCFLKDSLTYLDHINGRKHQRHLGYTMRVEKSTTDQVSGVLQGLADKKREREGNNRSGPVALEPADFEDMVRKKDEEALQRRARRREERKSKGKAEKANQNGTGQSLMAPAEELNSVEETQKTKEEDSSNNPAADEEGAEEEEEIEEGGMDPNLAAMMGFSGFGGSKK